jgi:hypothetical protein
MGFKAVDIVTPATIGPTALYPGCRRMSMVKAFQVLRTDTTASAEDGSACGCFYS